VSWLPFVGLGCFFFVVVLDGRVVLATVVGVGTSIVSGGVVGGAVTAVAGFVSGGGGCVVVGGGVWA
jgi:hypothetical protein